MCLNHVFLAQQKGCIPAVLNQEAKVTVEESFLTPGYDNLSFVVNRRVLLLALSLGFVIPLAGGPHLVGSPPQRQINIDRLSVTSLLLEALADGQPIGTATGFVVQKGENYYLLTNLHVVTGRNPVTNAPLYRDGAVPNALNILHNVKDKFGSWRLVRESLFHGETGEPRWIEHPERRRLIDVVALPLTNLTGIALYPLDLELRNTPIRVAPAEVITIVGFPYGQTAGAGLAIWKSGTIASDPDVDYGGQPVFLIDATTRPSMSGSPVYARRSGSSVGPRGGVQIFGGTRDRFLGIYAGRIHEDAEVGRVWKVDALMDIYEALL